jgi:hypothetical protein
MNSSGSENPDPTTELFLTDPYTYPHSKRPDPRISSFQDSSNRSRSMPIFSDLRPTFSGWNNALFKSGPVTFFMGTALGRDLFTAHNIQTGFFISSLFFNHHPVTAVSATHLD